MFKSKEDLGGDTDPRINTRGRPRLTVEEREARKVPTKRKMLEQELQYVLRKIKPHMTDSIMAAAKVMKSPTSTDQSKLKAAVILLDAYRTLVKDVYDVDEESTDKEQEEVEQEEVPAVVFSLKATN